MRTMVKRLVGWTVTSLKLYSDMHPKNVSAHTSMYMNIEYGFVKFESDIQSSVRQKHQEHDVQ